MILVNFFQKVRRFRLSNILKQGGASLDRKLVFRQSIRKIPSISQWKRLPRFLSRGEKWILRTLLLFLVFSSVIFAAGIIKKHIAWIPSKGGSWREAVVGRPSLINPTLAVRDTDRDLVKLIFSGLLRVSGDGEYLPDLAEELNVSPDGKIYTATLREGILFHDGEPLTSKDVLFTYEAIANPAWRSPFWKSLQGVTIEAPDEKTVVFKLPKPHAPFRSLLLMGIIPEHLWQEVNPANVAYAAWNIKPIGTGPFKFQSLTRTKSGEVRSIELTRNENYYLRSPWIKKFQFQFKDNLGAALNALREGRVDGLLALPGEKLLEVSAKRFMISSFFLPQVTTLFFNGRDNFLTKEVREALSLSFNRRELLDKLGSDVVEALGPITKEPLDFSKNLPPYNFDPERAKGVFKKAFEENKEAKITILAPPDSLMAEVANLASQSWVALGVPIKREDLNLKDFLEAARNREYSVLIWSIVTPHDPDLYAFWHSSQIDDPGLNMSAFRNRQVDILLEEAQALQDTKQRLEKYSQLQTIIREETPAVFLFTPSLKYATARKLGGLKLKNINLPSDRFGNVQEWYINRRLAWR